jgi:hypothetical protein
MDAQQLIDRCEYTIEYQKQEIDRLRAEVQRLTHLLEGKTNAHLTLQNIYSTPNSSEGNRLKAAAASLPFERPKLMPERAPLELAAEPEPMLLEELVKVRMERQDRLEAEQFELRSGLLLPVPGKRGNGDGSDDDDS